MPQWDAISFFKADEDASGGKDVKPEEMITIIRTAERSKTFAKSTTVTHCYNGPKSNGNPHVTGMET